MKNKYYKIAFYGIAIFLFFCLLSNKLNNNNNKMLKVRMLISKLAENKKNNSQVSYGMFATEFIKNGELIENCPVLIERVDLIKKAGIMGDYYFDVGNNRGAFPLGYGGMYNHSDKNNATASSIDLSKRTMKVEALRDIFPGEEVTVNYGPQYWKSRGIVPNV